MRDKMLDDVADVLGSKNKRIDELEAALRKAEKYIELVGGFGEGGTCEYEVALDAVREALRGSGEIWGVGLMSEEAKCVYCAAPDPRYPRSMPSVPAVVWCATHQCMPGAKPECPAPQTTAPANQQ